MTSPPSRWTLNLLGTFRLDRDGIEVVQFGGRRHELLLAYLALAPQVAHRRAPVAEALWPGLDQSVSMRHLSYNLWLVRKRLAELGLSDGLWIGARTMQLNPEVSTDVQRFGELVVEAVYASGREEQVRLLERALALYGDGLLPTYGFPWVEPERARLQSLYQAAVQRLAELLAPAGNLYPLLKDVPPATWRRHQAEALPPIPPSPPTVAPPAEPLSLLPGDRERVRAFVEEAEPYLDGPDKNRWLARLDHEYDVITLLLEQAIDRHDRVYGMEVAGHLWRYWYARGRVSEGRLILEQLLPGAGFPPATALAKALHAAGTLALVDGDLAPARRHLERALDVWRQLDDDTALAHTLANLALVAYREADFDQARRLYGECLAIARRTNDAASLVTRLLNAAAVEIQLGDSDSARELLEERLALVGQLGDQTERAVTLAHLATVAIMEEEPALARSQAAEAKEIFDAQGDAAGQALALRLLGRAAHEEGDFAAATQLYQQSLEAARASGRMREVAETLRQLARTAQATGDLEHAAALANQAEQMSVAAGDVPGALQAHSLAEKVTLGQDDLGVTLPAAPG